MPDTLTPSNPSTSIPSPVDGRTRRPSAGSSPRPAEGFDPVEAAMRRVLFHGLSKTQREVMKDHVHGPVPVDVFSRRHAAVKTLVAGGFLYFDRKPGPRFSKSTDKGRTAIAAMLAHEADRLVEKALGNA